MRRRGGRLSSSQGLVEGRSGRLDSRVKGRRPRGVGRSRIATWFGYKSCADLAGFRDELGDARRSFGGLGGVAFGGHDDGIDVIGCGCGDGEECWEFAGDVEDGAAFDGDGFKLACGEERGDDIADARAGGRGREGFDLFFGRDDGPSESEMRAESAAGWWRWPSLICL